MPHSCKTAQHVAKRKGSVGAATVLLLLLLFGRCKRKACRRVEARPEAEDGGIPGQPGPYRLLLLGPVHLEAVECVALPVLVQLPDDHGLHPLKKGCEPGAVVPGHGLHAHRLGGLSLHLGIRMLPGLGGRLSAADAGRLATFLEKEIKAQQSAASQRLAPLAQGAHPPSAAQRTFHVAVQSQANGPGSFCLPKHCPFPPVSSPSFLGGTQFARCGWTPPRTSPMLH